MTSEGPVRVGIIGAGMISTKYLKSLSSFPDVDVVAIGDLNTDRAVAQAEAFAIGKHGGPEAVLNNDSVELVVNLTIPAVHVEVSSAALHAGKHVWSEKPLGIERDSAARVVALAKERGLLLGVAPDTVLGPGWQTAKRAIEAGVIGRPLSAVTSFQSQGPDWFHPDPEFLFAKGAGPLFDIGPYYLTALVHLLGPISQVAAIGTKAWDERRIRTGARAGTKFPVEVPTHINVVSRFSDGPVASSVMSTDTALYRHGVFEVNGTEGTLVLGDPNYFGESEMKIYRPEITFTDEGILQAPEILEPEGPIFERGVGALTMARAIRRVSDLHIATGELAYHVLDTMVSIEESIEQQAFVEIQSTVPAVPSLPADFDPYTATL